MKLANGYAPEHLAIVAGDDEKLAAQIRTAGAIFLGGYSPVAAGDFVAGPSHELPTGGAGKSFPGLTVDQFQRRTSVVRLDRKSLGSAPALDPDLQRDRGPRRPRPLSRDPLRATMKIGIIGCGKIEHRLPRRLQAVQDLGNGPVRGPRA